VARTLFTIEQVLSLLEEAPGRIGELTAGLTPAQLRRRPGPEEWSANEVLAHLRACADVWGGCIRTILQHDVPTIRAVDPRTWMESTDYVSLQFAPSLAAFTKQRRELLKVLQGLTRKDWSRKAIVTGAGAVLERSVLTYGTRLARHERSHRKQFKRIALALRAK
jgi:DinB family protein